MSELVTSATTNPGTPASGKAAYWTSSANKRLWFTDDTGATGQVGSPTTTYYVDDYGVKPSNTAATNVTNMNTLLQTTAADKSQIVFGAGTYQFNAGLTTLTKDFAFVGIRGQTTIAITAAMGASIPFLKLSNAGYYTSLRDLNFVNFSAQSSNYCIQAQNNVNVEILDCFFTGAANWAGVLDFSGTNSGNGAILKNVYIANWANNAINISSPLDTMYIEDLEIIGTGVAGSVGIFCDNGGALLMSGCQIINADVNVKLAAADTKTVSAVFAVNCFFDQGKTNCLLITGAGTGTVARCHFVASWFTISASGSGGVDNIKINSTGTGIHAGIEFQDCWIMNATPGSTGTLNGINATAIQDLTVSGCQFAGWTNDISLTPASAATCSPTITANTFAAAGLIGASTNGIVLNAGATTYATINITGNTFGGKTTAANITDNSTVASGYDKVIRNNPGMGNDVYQVRNAAQTVSTSTMTAVSGLTFPITHPSLNYSFEAALPGVNIASTSATGIGVAVSIPAGATINWNVYGNTTTNTAYKNVFLTATSSSTAQSFNTSSGFTGMLQVRGVVSAGTATSHTGAVSIMLAAQGTATSTNNTVTVQPGAYLNAFKVT